MTNVALNNQTLVAVAMFPGQSLTLGTQTVTATEPGETLRVYGTGTATMGPGYWQGRGIFAGDYEGPYFDGDTPTQGVTTSVTYQRRDTPNHPWITLAENVDPGTEITDPTPILIAPEYRAISHTELPSSNTGPVTVAERPGGLWPVFLNTGPGFSDVVALYDNTRYSPSTERGKTRHKRAGRSFPVTKWGRHREHTYTLSATVNPNSPGATVADVQALEDEPHVACYRDVLGHKHFVTIDNISADVERNGWWNVTVPMTREDYDENELAGSGN